jgi:c(7)-type cytochrome triheme protein
MNRHPEIIAMFRNSIAPNRPIRLVVPVIALLLLCVIQMAVSAPGDLVIPRKGNMSTDSLPASTFPHWIHRVRYRCDVCHDDLFEMKLGASEITMDMMSQGGSCGTCHNGQVAFKTDFTSCSRCHKPAQ